MPVEAGHPRLWSNFTPLWCHHGIQAAASGERWRWAQREVRNDRGGLTCTRCRPRRLSYWARRSGASANVVNRTRLVQVGLFEFVCLVFKLNLARWTTHCDLDFIQKVTWPMGAAVYVQTVFILKTHRSRKSFTFSTVLWRCIAKSLSDAWRNMQQGKVLLFQSHVIIFFTTFTLFKMHWTS